MKFFIDSANTDEIRTAHEMGILSGVTTNPSLVAKEGRDFHDVLREIVAITDGPVSAEVVSEQAEEMVREGLPLAALAPNVVIKVPLTGEGLKAVHSFSRKGIRTNVTLVFSTNQALLAARAGASYVSPFVGRLDDIGQEGMDLVREIADVFHIHRLETEIIAASVRHPVHVTQAALAGAHIATIPFKVLQQLIHHPLTDIGIARFLSDWRQARQQG